MSSRILYIFYLWLFSGTMSYISGTGKDKYNSAISPAGGDLQPLPSGTSSSLDGSKGSKDKSPNKHHKDDVVHPNLATAKSGTIPFDLLDKQLKAEISFVREFYEDILTRASNVLECKQFFAEENERKRKKKEEIGKKKEERERIDEREEEEDDGQATDREQHYDGEEANKGEMAQKSLTTAPEKPKRGKWKGEKARIKARHEYHGGKIKETLCTALLQLIAISEELIGKIYSNNGGNSQQTPAAGDLDPEQMAYFAKEQIAEMNEAIVNFAHKFVYYTGYHINNEETVEIIKAKVYSVAYQHLVPVSHSNAAPVAVQHYDHWDDDLLEEEPPIQSPMDSSAKEKQVMEKSHLQGAAAYIKLKHHLKQTIEELKHEMKNGGHRERQINAACECAITADALRMQPEFDQSNIQWTMALVAVNILAYSVELSELASSGVTAAAEYYLDLVY